MNENETPTEKETPTIDGVEIIFGLLSVLLPIIDVLLVTRIFYVLTGPDSLSPFAAIPLGIIVGILVCVFLLAQRGIGNTAMEISIPAFFLFLLLLFLNPLTARMKQNAQIAARRQAQQKPTPPQPVRQKHQLLNSGTNFLHRLSLRS